MLMLYVLLLVTGGTWLAAERTTDWDEALWVVVHPIAGDNSSAAQAFVRSLTRESFADIEAFFAAQAKHYSVSLK